MPIKICTHEGDRSSEVTWLCDDDWRLPSQVAALKAWLAQNATSLSTGDYSADIGFAPRPEAAGGGAAITLDMMRQMVTLGMTLYFSEYPEMGDDTDQTTSKA